jgi:nitric oxide reductase subunit B
LVIGNGEISEGQSVWQAMGGMEIGSIWGHGSYVAPDWTADWLHRESEFMLNEWSTSQLGTRYDSTMPEQQAALRERLKLLMRTNKFDASTNILTIDSARAKAFEANQRYYADIFSNGNTGYAIPKGAQPDPVKLRQLGAFFFWTACRPPIVRRGDQLHQQLASRATRKRQPATP